MILYVENSRFHKKLLEQTNSAKLQDTKTTHKKQLCFNTLTLNNQKRRRKNNSIYSSIERIKYLGINFAKMAKSLYTKTPKMLLKFKNTQIVSSLAVQ